jgi:hypothetical protein
MANIIIQLENGHLDISKDIGFGVNYSIDDVRDPSKKNTAYSKTIVLPGTKNNNYQFGLLADVNSDFTFFNPNSKTKAKIIVDSTTIIDGFLQLKGIRKVYNTKTDVEEIEYDIVIYDNAVDFYSAIGKKLLSDLDLSEYNHIYSRDNIVDSWAHSSIDGYGYPNYYVNNNQYVTKSFKPAVFHKTFLKLIARDAGYSLGGTLMDSTTENGAIYDKEIIPYNGDFPSIPAAEYTRREFRAGKIGDTSRFVWSNTTYPRIERSSLQVTSLDDDFTTPNFDPNGHWNTATSTYTSDKNGTFDMQGKFYYKATFKTYRDDITKIEDLGTSARVTFASAHNFDTDSDMECQLWGTTNFNGNYSGNCTVLNTTQIQLDGIPAGTHPTEFAGSFGWQAYQQTYQQQIGAFATINEVNISSNGSSTWKTKVKMKKNGSIVSTNSSLDNQMPKSGSPSTPAFGGYNNFTVVQEGNNFAVDLNRAGLPLNTGDTVTFYDEFSNSQGNFNTSYRLKYVDRNNTTTVPVYPAGTTPVAKKVPVIMDLELVKVGPASGDLTYVKNVPVAKDLTDGDTIFMNDYVNKKVKQADLLTDLVKRYNLYVSIDPDNDKKLILDTRDDYYSAGSTLDWSDKKDYTKDKIKLLSELQSKEIHFTYKADSEYWNEEYSKKVDGETLGLKKVEFDNEFTKKTQKIETPFSPTPLGWESSSKTMVVPLINALTPKNNIRVLYYGGEIDTPTGKHWRFTHTTGGVEVQENFYSYCYAGHYDNPYDPTLSLNYGEAQFIWYEGRNNIPNDNLYNRHWKNYVEQIGEGRLVTSKFNLTEVDISYIRDNMNSKIHCNGVYYYINKIVDYDPTNDDLTTVELLKINDGITFVSRSRIDSTIDINDQFTDGGLLAGGDGSGDTGGTTGDGAGSNTVKGSKNYVDSTEPTVLIVGDENRVEENVTNSGIIGGRYNVIDPGVNNSWIIGADNKTVTSDNEVYVGDFYLFNKTISSEDEIAVIEPVNGLGIAINPSLNTEQHHITISDNSTDTNTVVLNDSHIMINSSNSTMSSGITNSAIIGGDININSGDRSVVIGGKTNNLSSSADSAIIASKGATISSTLSTEAGNIIMGGGYVEDLGGTHSLDITDSENCFVYSAGGSIHQGPDSYGGEITDSTSSFSLLSFKSLIDTSELSGIIGGSAHTIDNSDRCYIIGGNSCDISNSDVNNLILSSGTSDITNGSIASVIIGGFGHSIVTLGNTAIIGGGNITATIDNAVYVPDLVVTKSHTIPVNSASTNGDIGSITWDSGYIYVKTAVEAWKRAALSTF